MPLARSMASWIQSIIWASLFVCRNSIGRAPAACRHRASPISAANLREVAAMRCLLESHALRESFEAGDMEWEGSVVAAHRKLAAMERRMKAGERSQAQ